MSVSEIKRSVAVVEMVGWERSRGETNQTFGACYRLIADARGRERGREMGRGGTVAL